MKKIYLHIGLPKCASTSFQFELAHNSSITYPAHGLCLYEHLAIPLKLKGIDSWTAQWYDQQWVDSEYDRIIQIVRQASGTVVLSSERLFDISEVAIKQLRASFASDFEVLIFVRPFDSWTSSMWRHAVFTENLAISFEEFRKNYHYSDLAQRIDELSKHIKVNVLDITHVHFERDLAALIGVDMHLDRHNVGANQECCNFLRNIHVAVGSKEFKKYFTIDQKHQFSEMFNKASPLSIDVFDVPI